MSLVSNIFKNLNESAEVKKPYGDKPEEGKRESLAKGKKKSVPKGKKVDNKKVPVEKVQNVNKQAKDVYVNDTSKYEDNKDDTKHNDKGEIAKKNTRKATTVIKFPYGQKVEKASTKLVKEGEEVLKEERGSWVQIQNDVIRRIENAVMELEEAYPEEKEDRVSEFLTGLCDMIKEIAEEHGYYVDLYEGCKKEDK